MYFKGTMISHKNFSHYYYTDRLNRDIGSLKRLSHFSNVSFHFHQRTLMLPKLLWRSVFMMDRLYILKITYLRGVRSKCAFNILMLNCDIRPHIGDGLIGVPFTISVCGENIYDYNGYIQSPNYPNNYPSNIDCRSTIQVPIGRVQFTLLDLSTESGYDYLTVRKNMMWWWGNRYNCMHIAFNTDLRILTIYNLIYKIVRIIFELPINSKYLHIRSKAANGVDLSLPQREPNWTIPFVNPCEPHRLGSLRCLIRIPPYHYRIDSWRSRLARETLWKIRGNGHFETIIDKLTIPPSLQSSSKKTQNAWNISCGWTAPMTALYTNVLTEWKCRL